MHSLLVRRSVIGVGTAAAFITVQSHCQATPSMENAFSLDRPRYNETVYLGRVRNMFDIVDPRLLLVGDDELQKSRQDLDGELHERCEGSVGCWGG